MYVCYATGVEDIEAETPCETCTYVDESCVRGHHVSKDFCTPGINEQSKGQKFGVAHTSAQKNFSYCLLLLQSRYYGCCKGEPSLFKQCTPGWTQRSSLTLSVYGHSVC